MTVPTTNTTCDIYRSTSPPPPAAPDVAGVKCFLNPKGQSTLTTGVYTHVLLVPTGTDVRDQFPGNTFGVGPAADIVYVPDKNGTKFLVVLVRRQGRGTPPACL